MSTSVLSRPLAQRLAHLEQKPFAGTVEPDVPLPVLQAAGDALDRGETHYADRPGLPELRAQIADRLNQTYGLSVSPNAVTVTCGSVEARFSALHVLTQPGAAILAPRDADRIAATARLIGASVSPAPTGSTSLLYLTPGDDNRLWFDQAEAAGWWLLWDISGKPAPDDHPARRPALAPRTVTIDDLEAHLPGWAVGWMVGSDRHAELRAFKQAMTICTTNVSQWAALEWLRAN